MRKFEVNRGKNRRKESGRKQGKILAGIGNHSPQGQD